jgi:hypothetical protein
MGIAGGGTCGCNFVSLGFSAEHPLTSSALHTAAHTIRDRSVTA